MAIFGQVTTLCRTMTTQLSLDVLLCILDLLDDEDLRSLCRCCRRLNELIQPRFFHRLDLEHKEKSISFRHLLERSPRLAYYPREVNMRLGIQGTEDIDTIFVLGALTGKNISLVGLTGHWCGWTTSVALKTAVEALFQDTTIALDIILKSMQGLLASCLCLTRHLLLLDTVLCGALGPCTAKTISMTGFHQRLSLGALFCSALPFLTHLLLVWDPPASGERQEQWYAELGMALSNLPGLVLLTVHYYGKSR